MIKAYSCIYLLWDFYVKQRYPRKKLHLWFIATLLNLRYIGHRTNPKMHFRGTPYSKGMFVIVHFIIYIEVYVIEA